MKVKVKVTFVMKSLVNYHVWEDLILIIHESDLIEQLEYISFVLVQQLCFPHARHRQFAEPHRYVYSFCYFFFGYFNSRDE